MRKIWVVLAVLLTGCNWIGMEDREREMMMYREDSLRCLMRNDSIRMAEEMERVVRERDSMAMAAKIAAKRDSMERAAEGMRVPFEEFLKFGSDGGGVMRGVAADDSIVPFVYYEYFYNDKASESWSGAMVGVPKIGSGAMRKFWGSIGSVHKEYLGYLSDVGELTENFDLYVYYVSKEQHTNLNSEGEAVVIFADEGESVFDWGETEEAVALVYHYEDGEWKFVMAQATEGSARTMAARFAKEVLRGR